MAVIRIDRDGRQSTVYVAGSEGDVWAFYDGRVYRQREQAGPPEGGHYQLNAPMPATVVKVLVAPGQHVRHGDTLVVLEAMKMELAVAAPHEGRIRAIACHVGELVQPGVPLVEFDERPT